MLFTEIPLVRKVRECIVVSPQYVSLLTSRSCPLWVPGEVQDTLLVTKIPHLLICLGADRIGKIVASWPYDLAEHVHQVR